MPDWINWLGWAVTVVGFLGWVIQGLFGWWKVKKLKEENARLRLDLQRLRGLDLCASGVTQLLTPAAVATDGVVPPVPPVPAAPPADGALPLGTPRYPGGISAAAVVDEWQRGTALRRRVVSGPVG